MLFVPPSDRVTIFPPRFATRSLVKVCPVVGRRRPPNKVVALRARPTVASPPPSKWKTKNPKRSEGKTQTVINTICKINHNVTAQWPEGSRVRPTRSRPGDRSYRYLIIVLSSMYRFVSYVDWVTLSSFYCAFASDGCSVCEMI